MPTGTIDLQDFDLICTSVALKNLSNLLGCSKCHSRPERSQKLLNNCGHSLCADCAKNDNITSSGGSCPVPACGMLNSGFHSDRVIEKRSQGFQQIQMAIQGVLGSDEKGDPPHKIPSLKSDPKRSAKAPNTAHKRPARESLEADSKTTPVSENCPKTKNSKKLNAPGKKSRKSEMSEETHFKNFKKPVVPKSSNPMVKLNKKNVRGETKLHVACIKGQLDVVLRLLEQGADSNTQDNNGWTPLHEAAQKGFTDIVRGLLQHGTAVNVPGGDELDTPLHEAASAGFISVVQLLIKHGAKKDSLNSNGKTPRDVACNKEVVVAIDTTDSDQDESQILRLEASILDTSCSEDMVLYLDSTVTKAFKSQMISLQSEHNFKIEKSLTDSVTHAVFLTDRNQSLQKPTANFYRAILSGIWVLNQTFLVQALETGNFPEESKCVLENVGNHSLEASIKAVENKRRKFPKLFQGFNIFLQTEFQPPFPSKEELANILTVGGATMLTREPDPESIPESGQKIPYHASNTEKLSKCSHYIIYQDSGKRDHKIKYNMKHIKSMPVSWLFRCIHKFCIVDNL